MFERGSERLVITVDHPADPVHEVLGEPSRHGGGDGLDLGEDPARLVGAADTQIRLDEGGMEGPEHDRRDRRVAQAVVDALQMPRRLGRPTHRERHPPLDEPHGRQTQQTVRVGDRGPRRGDRSFGLGVFTAQEGDPRAGGLGVDGVDGRRPDGHHLVELLQQDLRPEEVPETGLVEGDEPQDPGDGAAGVLGARRGQCRVADLSRALVPAEHDQRHAQRGGGLRGEATAPTASSSHVCEPSSTAANDACIARGFGPSGSPVRDASITWSDSSRNVARIAATSILVHASASSIARISVRRSGPSPGSSGRIGVR